MLEINGKQYSDEEVAQVAKECVAGYLEWRKQHATEFLKNKKRTKHYHCEAFFDPDSVNDFYIPLTDNVINRVRAAQRDVANDPTCEDDDDRDDLLKDKIAEIGCDIDVDITPYGGSEWFYTSINPDDFIYVYRFDIQSVNTKGEPDERITASVALTDEEYISLLAFLMDKPKNSFHTLLCMEEKMRRIHSKVMAEALNYYHLNTHDFAVIMTEAREDAQLILEQLKKNNECYPHMDILQNPMVGVIAAQVEMKKRQK